MCGREVKHTTDQWGWHVKSTVILGAVTDLSSGRDDFVEILGDKNLRNLDRTLIKSRFSVKIMWQI